MRLWVNDREQRTDEPGGTALLDYLRDSLGLFGTKAGCREGDCGACTVLVGTRRDGRVEYEPVCACLTPLVATEDRHVVTVEGLSQKKIGPVQRAILDEGATQCGFCTPGIVLSLTGYLLSSQTLSAAEAISSIAGNLCRCTGYESIRRACRSLVSSLPRLEEPGDGRLRQLVELGAWPESFARLAHSLPTIAAPTSSVRPTAKSAIVVGGGTDLLVQRPALVRGSRIVLSSAFANDRIEEREDAIVIGAATTVAQLERSALIVEQVPQISRIASRIASPQIRSRATLAGNLVNASPIGDLTILLLALNATVFIDGENGQRAVPLEKFFLSYKKVDLLPGELIVALRLPRPGFMRLVSFEKVSKRTYLDIASVNSACSVELDGQGVIRVARLSAGGVTPVPKLLSAASRSLAGQRLDHLDTDAMVQTALKEVSPIDDIRGSSAYKRELLGRMVLAHIDSFVSQFRYCGETP